MIFLFAFAASPPLLAAEIQPPVPEWLSYALIAFGVLVLASVLMRLLNSQFGLGGRGLTSGRMRLTLNEAAELAYQRAKRKRLPLVAVAEQNGESAAAVQWFANNIFCIVPVRGKRASSGKIEAIKRSRQEKLCVVGDGNAIGHLNEESPRYVEVYVEARDLEKYMKWARSVH